MSCANTQAICYFVFFFRRVLCQRESLLSARGVLVVRRLPPLTWRAMASRPVSPHKDDDSTFDFSEEDPEEMYYRATTPAQVTDDYSSKADAFLHILRVVLCFLVHLLRTMSLTMFVSIMFHGGMQGYGFPTGSLSLCLRRTKLLLKSTFSTWLKQTRTRRSIERFWIALLSLLRIDLRYCVALVSQMTLCS